MNQLLRNIVTGWITTTIGSVAILLGIGLIALDQIPVWPNACLILFVGIVLLLCPDKAPGIIDAIVKKKSE